MASLNSTIAFGIDLAGYTKGKSVCAAATAGKNRIQITILRGCPFSTARKTSDGLEPIVRDEVRFLRKLLARGPVAVDVPIDIDGLRRNESAKRVWELTLRPIDRTLKALPALADKIGAATARFQNILATGYLHQRLGKRLFETYPAGSLRRLSLDCRGYKGDTTTASLKRKEIARALRIGECELSDDELDAAICAITALPRYRLGGLDLSESLALSLHQIPKGYILLRTSPAVRVTVAHEEAERWLQ